MRISRIQLSDHLHPAACAASRADGSPSLPFDTADIVCTGTGSSSASEQTANCVDVCVGAITATRSARPNRSGERSGCCCRPENRYTTQFEKIYASLTERLWVEVLNLGASDLVSKPFEAKEVLHVLSMACRRERSSLASLSPKARGCPEGQPVDEPTMEPTALAHPR